MKIAGYQIARKVSTGRHCVIYNAIEQESSNTVSVRLFHHAASKTVAFQARFEQICKVLIDQTIGVMVPIKKAGVNDTGCYVISDHFPSFQRQTKLGEKIDIELILKYADQLAITLDQIHAKGLVHGGVEIGNLYFPKASEIVLGLPDFHRTISDNLSITIDMKQDDLSYLAPEAMTSGVSIATDFYALGTVLFELVFKCKPFLSDNPAQLLQLQKACNLKIPDLKYQSLMPLFQQLLHPDPYARICNKEHYHQVLQQCGLNINDSKKSLSTKSTSSDSVITPSVTIPSKFNSLRVVALIIILIAGSSFYYLSSSEDIRTGSVSRIESKVSEQTVIVRSPELSDLEQEKETEDSKIEVDNPQSRALALYHQAVEKLQDINLGHALILVNNALKENPEHVPSQHLKVEIEQKIEIRSIVEKANQQLAAAKILKPENDNVMHSYQQLGKKIGKNHPQVIEGYVKIANYYLQQAIVYLDRNQFERSKNLVATGLSVRPEYDPLKKLLEKIQKTENLIKQQQIQQAEEQRLRREQELELQKQREAESAQLAQQREREQLELQEAELIQQKINAYITQGEQILAVDPFNLNSLSAATRLYYQAALLEPRNIRALVYRQNIVNAYIALSNRHYQSADFVAARESVTIGLKLDSQHPGLLNLQNQIETQLKNDQSPAKPIG